jgi:phosphohistidine phosphatase
VGTDFERPLSEAGRLAARRAAGDLSRRGAAPRLILCSPLPRAVETAREASEVLGRAEVREFKPLLNMIAGERMLRGILRAPWAQGELLLVGHNPQMSEAASFLAGRVILLATAQIAAFEVDDRKTARLLFEIRPA